MIRRLFLLAILIVATSPVAADDVMPASYYAYRQLDDPAREAEAKELMETLRCLVCQSQSIVDSDASMAGDMRHEVRLRIARGEDPDSIRRWMIARYGEWISYDPPFNAGTAMLWIAPAVLAGIGIAFAWPLFRGRRSR